MPGPFAYAFDTVKRYRYVLLVGTLLSTLTIPLWGAVSDARELKDGSFVVAQRPDDPKQKGKGQPGQQGQGQQGQPGQKGTGQQQQQGQQGQPQGQPKGAGQQQQQQQGQQGQPKAPAQLQIQQGQQQGQPQQGQQQQGQQGLPKGAGQQQQQGQQGLPKSGQQQQGQGLPKGPGQQQQGQQGLPKGPGQQQQGQQGLPKGPGQQQQQQGQQGLPKGQPQIQQGQQPATGQQQQQFGNQPPAGGQPQQRQLGNQPPAGGQQQQQFGNQPPAGGQQQQQFGNQPGGRPQVGGGQPQPGQPQITINNTINVEQVRTQRNRVVEPSGRVVIQEPGNRAIVRENGRVIIRNDDNVRFQMFAPNARVTRQGNENLMVYERPGGYQIINVTDANGHLLRRVRRGPDGREYVLIDNRRGPGFGTGLAVGLAAGAVASAVYLNLAPPVVTIPRERYIVTAAVAPPTLLFETLDAPPLVAIERPYSLDEIRFNVELRDRVRRIDIDTITFESGSWELAPSQYQLLAQIAQAMLRVIERNPNAVFLVEGHTDAVGADEDNLSLSDRRAETVAVILTQQFNIGPEYLVTQGYGEQHLKVPTSGPSRENRRVAIRAIHHLMQAQAGR